MILMARSYTRAYVISVSRGRERKAGRDRSEMYGRAETNGEVPRGRAINADCAELPR